MTEFAKFIARHPVAVGLILSAAAGYSVWNAYQIGMRVQQIRDLVGDGTRAASEALGG